MNVYLAGTPVTLTIPLQDRSGNALIVDSLSYRVVDYANTELVPLTALAGFIAGSSAAVVTVSGLLNALAAIPAPITSSQIDAFTTREVRTVELLLSVGGSTILMTSSYGLESADPLVVGLNSFQSLPQAELNSLDIPNLVAWGTASDNDKIAAMIDARAHILQLNFSLLNSNINWGQDNMNFIPEGAYQSPYAGIGTRLFMFNGNLSLLTPTQFVKLPVRFKLALAKAQVAEADSIMSGDTVEAKRREGLMLDTIGETKQMYRAGKPLDLPVSKRALKYLSQFVTFSKHIGRG
jgi:hypothetical protein